MTARRLQLSCVLNPASIPLPAASLFAPSHKPASSLADIVAFARLAEQVGFDTLVCEEARSHDPDRSFEPFTTCSALAAATRRIGLVATASPLTDEPFNLARRLASLDHTSQSRAGWSIDLCTPPALGAAARERAGECLDVCTKLWGSWGVHTIVPEEAGARVDDSQNRPIDHHGSHFQVRGPLDVPRPARGRPLILISVRDDADIPLAVRHADQVVTSQSDIDAARRFADGVRRCAREIGKVNAPRVVQGIIPLIVSGQADVDMLKRKLASALTGKSAGDTKQTDLMTVAGAQLFIGTASAFANFVAKWMDEGAADGFCLSWPSPSKGLDLFAREIHPRLATRGWFGTAAAAHRS